MPSHSAAENALIYFRPLTLAYVRHEGKFAECLAAAWSDLRERIAAYPLELESPLVSYGLLHSSPDGPGGASVRYDACIEVPHGIESTVRGKLAIQLFNGGVFIAGPARRRHDELASSFQQLKSDPMVTHGLRFDSERPAVITYTRTSTGAAWQVALNIPIRSAADEANRAA